MIQDLWGEIVETQELLDLALAEAKKRGREMVAAEAHYYTVKSETAYRLKEEGQAVSFIAMVIKGEPDVCDAMTAYHARQVEYENAREARNVYKKRLDTLREQYQREWSQSGTTC